MVPQAHGADAAVRIHPEQPAGAAGGDLPVPYAAGAVPGGPAAGRGARRPPRGAAAAHSLLSWPKVVHPCTTSLYTDTATILMQAGEDSSCLSWLHGILCNDLIIMPRMHVLPLDCWNALQRTLDNYRP